MPSNDASTPKTIDIKTNLFSKEKEETLKGLEEFDNIFNNLCKSHGGYSNPNISTDKYNSLSDVSVLFEETINNESHLEIVAITNKTNVKQENKECIENTGSEIHKDRTNKIHENIIDIISISSDEENSMPITEAINMELLNTTPLNSIKHDHNDENYESDCSGYHSSDFEFITESEAKLGGLIIKRFKTGPKNPMVPGSSSSNMALDDRSNGKVLGGNNEYTLKFQQASKLRSEGNPVEPGPCSWHEKFRSNPSHRDPAVSGHSSTNNVYLNNRSVHNYIPDGEEYFDLFRGIYDPVLPLSTIHIMENKSVRTTSMNVDFEGIGFDMRLMRHLDYGSQDEVESEAEDNAKKILAMYPGDNRKRRRRH